MRVDSNGLGGARKLDFDSCLGRLDQFGRPSFVQEGRDANLALCGYGRVVYEGDDTVDGCVEQCCQHQILAQCENCAELGDFRHIDKLTGNDPKQNSQVVLDNRQFLVCVSAL